MPLYESLRDKMGFVMRYIQYVLSTSAATSLCQRISCLIQYRTFLWQGLHKGADVKSISGSEARVLLIGHETSTDITGWPPVTAMDRHLTPYAFSLTLLQWDYYRPHRFFELTLHHKVTPVTFFKMFLSAVVSADIRLTSPSLIEF
jgi:hypothetical protein